MSKWLVTMVSKSPKWGYSPYKLPFHGLYMGVILTTYKSWDDPPSSLYFLSHPGSSHTILSLSEAKRFFAELKAGDLGRALGPWEPW